MTASSRLNLFDYDRAALTALLAEQGEPGFRATQLIQWAHQQGVTDFVAMSNLAKTLRAKLEQTAEWRLPRVVQESRAPDGVVKWALEVQGGSHIETVFIPEEGRGTLCVSSQAGCILDCSFCATARQGFNRNLDVSEIIGQLWIALTALQAWSAEPPVISNVVFMGMGEPLYNYRNVLPALRLMTDDLAYGLSRRRVTVSTSGVVPGIHDLARDAQVALAVSLHAPDDALRDELVPINRRYPLAELLAACRAYVQGKPKQKVTFEYVMLEGVNDSPAQARGLARLLAHVPSKINLIPFNPFPGAAYRCSSPDAIRRFQQILQAAGYVTTLRKTRGQPIDAACGQLAGRIHDRTRRIPPPSVSFGAAA